MTATNTGLLDAAVSEITTYLDAWNVTHVALANLKEETRTIIGWGVETRLAINEDGTVWAYCHGDSNGYVGPAAGNSERIAHCLADRARFANVPAV